MRNGRSARTAVRASSKTTRKNVSGALCRTAWGSFLVGTAWGSYSCRERPAFLLLRACAVQRQKLRNVPCLSEEHCYACKVSTAGDRRVWKRMGAAKPRYAYMCVLLGSGCSSSSCCRRMPAARSPAVPGHSRDRLPTVPEKSRLRTRKKGRTDVRPSLSCGIR